MPEKYADDVAYVGIGNSDDKLTQSEWCNFICEVYTLCMSVGGIMVGHWYSEPASVWQNACFCIGGVKPQRMEFLRKELGVLAAKYRQDTISLVEGKTVLIEPAS